MKHKKILIDEDNEAPEGTHFQLFGSKLKYKLGAKKVDGIHPCLSVIHP
jgi:hypothetical protein